MTRFSASHPGRKAVILDELTVRAILGRIHPLHTMHVSDTSVSAPAGDVLSALAKTSERTEGLCNPPARSWLRIFRLRLLCLDILFGEKRNVTFEASTAVIRWTELRQRRAERELADALSS